MHSVKSGGVFVRHNKTNWPRSVNGIPTSWTIRNAIVISTPEINGTVTGGGIYEIDSSAVLMATPNTGYHFVQWSDSVTDNPRTIVAQNDTTITAVFSINRYAVTWLNADSTVLEKDSADYGSMPSYDGETPVKERDDDYVYIFSGWSPELTEVTADATYTAVFTAQSTEGIENSEISTQNSAIKVLRDGQLIIISNGREYNAQGVLMNERVKE